VSRIMIEENLTYLKEKYEGKIYGPSCVNGVWRINI